ncbi:hypothetical protein MKS88_004547 [Plasmodium brasilianum]|uniref:Uncharacterized protein n=1 Tax=Plasmodium brasilianum TaxID=5824 RepID=A0ACB9Y7T2_PLABR|nr:hypothetical protein MKS88_004547 [Plasmodium brasilianum]
MDRKYHFGKGGRKNNNYSIVFEKRKVNKSHANFMDYDDSDNTEILKNHLKDLKQLKENVIKKRNQSKALIRTFLDSFFSNKETNYNFDIFYDKCLLIIKRYLLVYKEINDILLKRSSKDGGTTNCVNVNSSLRDEEGEYRNNIIGGKNAPISINNNNSPDNNYNNNNNDNSNISNRNCNGNFSSNHISGNSGVLYDLIDNNMLIHNNRLLFDYDDDSEIYTSSEEEIVIESKSFKKKKSIKGNNKNRKNYANDSDYLKNNNRKDVLKEKEYFDRMEKERVTRRYKKRSKKICLLNRYPSYLRDLIRIVKIAKNQEKKILKINFLKKYSEYMNRNKLNTLFNKLYISNCYMNNKSYIEKKKKRLLYRIVRHKLVNYLYKNHDIFLEKLLKKKNSYNNLSIENIEKLLETHNCAKCSLSSTLKSCKMCKEKVKILFYITFYDNLNYTSILRNANSKDGKGNKTSEAKHLLTHIFLNKKEKRKTINVEYDISYHENKYIYMVSKNNIFCHILHENYIRDNFNDLLLRIKNGSRGYNLLHVIFNKYKNKNYFNYKKMKPYLENFYRSTSSTTGSSTTSGVRSNSQRNIEGGILLVDSFYDNFSSVIVKDEKNVNIFYDKVFENFYNILYMDKSSSNKIMYRNVGRKEIEVVNCDGGDSDADDVFSGGSINDKLMHLNNYSHGVGNYIGNNSGRHPSNVARRTRNEEGKLTLPKEMSKVYMNVKKMSNIDDQYIDDGAWDKNYHNKYYYLKKMTKKNSEVTSRNDNNMMNNTFNDYFKKINEETAILVNSDDSDENIQCNRGKTQYLMNYLKGVNSRNVDGSTCNKFILERYRMRNYKKYIIVHPLINSKCIGFKINVKDIANRDLDIYCINNTEYVNAYKNTVHFLMNSVNIDMKKKYDEYKNIRSRVNKGQNGVHVNELDINGARKSGVHPNDVDINVDYANVDYANVDYANVDYINESRRNKNTVNEYIVVIDENMVEDKYKIDIYDYGDVTAYIVNTKKEKKKEFYSNFIRNEIYTHRWINRLQFKLQNYSNVYEHSYIKSSHLKQLKEYLYGLLINCYYENIYDVSFNILLSSNYRNFNPEKEYVLKNISYNLNGIYQNLLMCIQSDILNYERIRSSNNKVLLDEPSIQLRVNNYLLNNKWNKQNREFFDQIINKYRFIFLYYMVYTYPKFLHIFNIIKTKNFRAYIKNCMPEKDNDHQHIHVEQKGFTSEKKILKSAKKNKIENNMEETLLSKDVYLPPYKVDSNILNAFSLSDLLLVDINKEENHFENSTFLNVLNGVSSIETVGKQVHPTCYNTFLFYMQNNNQYIKNIMRVNQIATIFSILNAYLSFITARCYNYFRTNNLWKYLIYNFKEIQKTENYEEFSIREKDFPSSFVQRFLDTFLLKKNDSYFVSDRTQCKLLVYTLLIQLCLTDNLLPLNLALINKNISYTLRELNFTFKGRKAISFNIQA